MTRELRSTGRTRNAGLALIFCACNSYHEINLVEPTIDNDFRIILTQDKAEIFSGSEPFRLDARSNPSDEATTEIWLFAYNYSDLAEHYPQIGELKMEETLEFLRTHLIRGESKNLLTPSLIYSLDLSSNASESIQYNQRDWKQWITRVETGFPGFYFDSMARSCPYSVKEISTRASVVENMEITSVTFSSTTAYMVGTADHDGGYLFRISQDDELVPMTRLTNPSRGRRHIMANNSGKLFVTATEEPTRKSALSIYDRLGNLLPNPSIPVETEIKHVDVGNDQSVFMSGPDGIFEYLDSSNSLMSRTSYPYEPKTMKVLTRDHIYAVNDQETRLSHYDGREWTAEYIFTVGDNTDKLGGDEDVIVMVGPYELILERDSSEVWKLISPVYGHGRDLYGVDGFGGGQYVVVGAGGLVGIRKDNYWCRFSLGNETRFESVAVAPDQSHAFVVGLRKNDNNEKTGAIYKISLKP